MAEENQKVEKPAEPKANLAMTARGFEPTDMESAYRYAKVISLSDFATPMYKNNEANCTLLLDVSMRMGVPWIMLMQHMYIVHERPALDSTISTALVNMSGVFADPIEYEVEGKEARDKDYRVRAYATRKSTGTVLYGPWIDWPLVRGEAWDAKAGSKWKTMPDQMFHYRAASWFQRRYCPELTMGMMTPEEVFESPRRKVDAKTIDVDKSTIDRILTKSAESTKSEKPKDDHVTDTSKKVDEKKEADKKAAKKAKDELDARSKKQKKKTAKKETTPAPPQEPKTEKEEPKLVKCPKCGKEVDPAASHDCIPPEILEENDPPTGKTETTVDEDKDKWKCLRCDRKLKDNDKDIKNGKCAKCMGNITELK